MFSCAFYVGTGYRRSKGKVLSTKIHLNLNVRMQNANLVKYLADSDKWPSPSFFQGRVPSFYSIR